jgi:hypothetical protein
MKLTVSVTGQDQRRVVERVEQLVRTRIANTQPTAAQDTPPSASAPTRRQPHPDRRS